MLSHIVSETTGAIARLCEWNWDDWTEDWEDQEGFWYTEEDWYPWEDENGYYQFDEYEDDYVFTKWEDEMTNEQ